MIRGKWTTLVLRELLAGTRRYSDLKRALGRVSPKTLTERLRYLEDEGLLTRTVHAEVPPRVEYTLTPQGESLGEIIAALGRRGHCRGGSRAGLSHPPPRSGWHVPAGRTRPRRPSPPGVTVPS